MAGTIIPVIRDTLETFVERMEVPEKWASMLGEHRANFPIRSTIIPVAVPNSLLLALGSSSKDID